MCVFVKMKKIEVRNYHKIFAFEKQYAYSGRGYFGSVYGDFAPSLTKVKFLVDQLKHGQEDGERLRGLKTATTSENISNVPKILPDDCQIEVREIAEAISYERACHTLNQDLGITKPLERWVSYFADVRPNMCWNGHF